MPGKIRIILLSVILLLGLAVAGLTGIGLYISANADDYKTYLTEVIAEKTSVQVHFDGEFSVSVFPWIGVELENVRVENPPHFQGKNENLLRAEKLGVELGLFPLLRGNVAVEDVRIDGLDLRLLTDGEAANWVFAPEGEHSQAVADSQAQPAGSEETSSSSNWKIGRIILQNSNISYLDINSGDTYSLSDINLTAGELAAGEKAELELTANIAASAPKAAGALNLDAQFSFAGPDNFEISQLSGKFIPQDAAPLKEVSLELSLALQGYSLDLRQCLLSIGENRLNLAGKANLAQPGFNGALHVQSNPRQLLSMSGIELNPAAGALQSFTLDAQLSADAKNELKISSLTARLDSSSLNGELNLTGGNSPQITGELNIDSVLLDNYLPAPEKDANPAPMETQSKGGSSSSGEKIPEETYTPPSLELNIDLSLNRLVAKGMEFQNIKAKLLGKNAVYSLDPLTINFADAIWKAQVSADLQKKTPALHMVMNVRQFAMEQLLKGLTGKEQIIGKADFSADVRANGSEAASLTKSLGGSLKLAAKGNLKDFKLPKINLASDSGADSLETVDARLNNFSASLKGEKGIFTNRDMTFDTSMGRGKGSGSINLGNSSLDYLVTVETNSVNLPVRISGPFSNLAFTLDVGAMLSDPSNLRKGAEKLFDKEEEGLGNKLGRELERGLGKLFGN
ncbi:MAG: AsmA family protein [Desulfovibrionaceae bacterium]|nr:AsmA family protein [Desulfovibrionaceae bacterium]